MPMPPYPPAQVTRTITFRIAKGAAQADGTPSGNVQWINADNDYASPDIFASGPASVEYRTYLYENGSGTPTDGADEPDAPDLVSASWGWQARLYNNLDPIGPYFLPSAPTVDVAIQSFTTDSQTIVHNPADPPNQYRPQLIGSSAALPDFSGFDFLFAIGDSVGGGQGQMSCDNPPSWGDNAALAYVNLEISGSAVWLAWWWRLPERNDCSIPNPRAPMIYRRQDPSDETGYQWEKYDPDDPSAHPTPVVEEIEPNHGPIAGGTRIKIVGSGFGTEATVTIDGVPAIDVDVIDEETIEATVPPHVIGNATVIVTNFDGVSSAP